ncbi:MAG: efflux RND transporter periplasmic adaptor subunit [Clostridia bacterium]|nr:MAG: efflux RND transporter periplasmic adaptor subunit [Clostridia bacterium]
MRRLGSGRWMAGLHKRALGFGAAGLILTAGLLAGCGLNQETSGAETKTEVPVEVALVARGNLQQSSTINGQIQAKVEVNVVPKAQGKVQSVAVDVGDVVKAGLVLVRLDTTDIDAQIRQAEAAVEAARKGLALLQAGATPQQIEAARAQVSQAETNYNAAKTNLERMQFLFAQGAISQQQLDAAQAQHDAAQAGLDAARANLSGLEAGARKEQVEQVQAQVKQAEAALNVLSTQKANFTVTAPVSGVVAARNIDPGEMASPAMPVITLAQLDPVLVQATVSEREINYLKPGQEVKVQVPAVQAEAFTGRISALSPVADPRSRGYTVKIEIANPKGLLKPGMAAQLQVGLETIENQLIIPVQALVDKGQAMVVYIVEDGKALEKTVTVALETQDKAAISNGLAEGQQVVVSGQNYLRNGDPVRVLTGNGGKVQ